MVANKYAFLQITRRRFLNEWEAFKKVISRRNIRRRITIPLTLSNLKLLRRITRTENILHRNFTRRQVAIQNRVASNLVCRLLLEKKNQSDHPCPAHRAWRWCRGEHPGRVPPRDVRLLGVELGGSSTRHTCERHRDTR